jgi:hypothetical protein
MKCDTCKKEYSPNCDFNQGRCPMHMPLINFQASWKNILADILTLFLIAMVVAPLIVSIWILLDLK